MCNPPDHTVRGDGSSGCVSLWMNTRQEDKSLSRIPREIWGEAMIRTESMKLNDIDEKNGEKQ